MENHNFVSKNIRELKLEDNNLIHDPNLILVEMRKFYEKLYSPKDTIDISDSPLLNLIGDLPKLTELEKNNLEIDITLEELKSWSRWVLKQFFQMLLGELRILLLHLMIFFKKGVS